MLNVNGLSFPIKDTDWQNASPYPPDAFCETHFRFKDKDRLKVKE